MQTHRSTRRAARRGLFKIWVGVTIVFATALALVLPFIQGERFAFLAGIPVVALNLTLLALALGWLIWHVFIAEPGAAPDERGGTPGSNDEGRADRAGR